MPNGFLSLHKQNWGGGGGGGEKQHHHPQMEG